MKGIDVVLDMADMLLHSIFVACPPPPHPTLFVLFWGGHLFLMCASVRFSVQALCLRL